MRHDDPVGPRDRHECGERRNVLLQVVGDETALVSPGEVGWVPLGEGTLDVLNPGSFIYEGSMNCTDTWGPTHWMAWR